MTENGIPRIDSECWHLIKETSKVMGFIGGTADRPLPITDAEADMILQRVQDGVEKPKPKVLFEPGQMVRVVDGPFNDFNGVVEEDQLRQEPPARGGADLRSVHPGGAGVRPGRKGLTPAPPARPDEALKTCYSFWLPAGSRNRPAAMCGRRCEQDSWCATPGRVPLRRS